MGRRDMSDMKTLTELMKELEDRLAVCMRCGMCQAVCPLFEQTGREADVARGKLALLDGLMKEMFQNPKGTFERLNRCLLCGSCAENCPSNVNVLEIFMKARAILTGYMGLSPSKRILLRGMLSHPTRFDRMAEWGAKFQNLFTRPVNNLIGTSCVRFTSPLLSKRHFPPLAPEPFHHEIPRMNSVTGRANIKVLFYVGCLIDKIFPRVARAAISILHHHGVGVFIPENMGCCGIPAISSGDMKTFNQLVRHNINQFNTNRFDYLVTACATCTATIKTIWPYMVRKSGQDEKDIVQEVAVLSEKVMDINQFLVEKVQIEPRTQNMSSRNLTVTYHDPCHLKKSLGVAKAPRQLINANSDYRLKEMTASDWCCGLGGNFNLQYYEISAKIGEKKRKQIVDTGCSTVATGCPACMIQIADMLSRHPDPISIKHPVEIYAEGLSLDPFRT